MILDLLAKRGGRLDFHDDVLFFRQNWKPESAPEDEQDQLCSRRGVELVLDSAAELVIEEVSELPLVQKQVQHGFVGVRLELAGALQKFDLKRD